MSRDLGPDRGLSVASLAATAGVVPRTLQRHFRKRTGLAPKRYVAVQRFSGALKQVALGGGSLADIASEAGYCDQAHLTTELGRHAGLPPGRFRALARRQIVRDAVRFFKDATFGTGYVSSSAIPGVTDDEETDGEIQSEGPNFEARVRTSFARQTAMATLGIEIADLKPGEIELRMPYTTAYTQQHGFIHAGIITTALDTACGYAAFSLMPDDAAVLTVEFKTNLIAPLEAIIFCFGRASSSRPNHHRL